MKTLTPREERHRLTLYECGMNDAEIARALGISSVAVCQWRRRRGLPRRDKRRERIIQRRAWVEEGLSDAEIAKREGCAERTISTWRQRRGLGQVREHHAARVSYKDALPPEKHAKMEAFLRRVRWLRKKAIQLGFRDPISAVLSGIHTMNGGTGRCRRTAW